LENDVQNTAGFTGRHHVRIELFKHSRMFGHRIGQRHTGLDVGSRLKNDFLKMLVVLLLAQDLETLHERKSRVQHYRELPCKQREVLALDLLAANLWQADLPAFLACAG